MAFGTLFYLSNWQIHSSILFYEIFNFYVALLNYNLAQVANFLDIWDHPEIYLSRDICNIFNWVTPLGSCRIDLYQDNDYLTIDSIREDVDSEFVFEDEFSMDITYWTSPIIFSDVLSVSDIGDYKLVYEYSFKGYKGYHSEFTEYILEQNPGLVITKPRILCERLALYERIKPLFLWQEEVFKQWNN